jgi:putative glutamine amidotransferase
MHNPIIGITCNQESSAGAAPQERLSAAYTRSVIEAGGLPLIIPTDFPLEELADLRQRLDGILLTGGGDVDPSRYRGKQHPNLIFVSEARDSLEIELTKLAVQTNWPVLGVCRGMQVMNVALHGTLYTHLPTQISSKLDHNTPYDQGRNFIAHEVTIEAGTHLADILGKSKLPVNSFHHQAVKTTAPTLKISAHATDGLVEGVELPDLKFFIGVQWHPECIQEYKEQQLLFQAFIQAARPA